MGSNGVPGDLQGAPLGQVLGPDVDQADSTLQAGVVTYQAGSLTGTGSIQNDGAQDQTDEAESRQLYPVGHLSLSGPSSSSKPSGREKEQAVRPLQERLPLRIIGPFDRSGRR